LIILGIVANAKPKQMSAVKKPIIVCWFAKSVLCSVFETISKTPASAKNVKENSIIIENTGIDDLFNKKRKGF